MGKTELKIAVASGKGGTGKTLTAVNLAYLLHDMGRKVCFRDCDVEEPNGELFLKPQISSVADVNVSVPSVNEKTCVSCGKCAEECRFGALTMIKEKVLSFPELCHSCGLCRMVCPAGSISWENRKIGEIRKGSLNGRMDFFSGELSIGEVASPRLISRVLKQKSSGQYEVVDCPPGTSCPMVEAVSDADFVILVTEPTPFGLHDLEITFRVISKMKIPAGIVINRSSGIYPPLMDFIRKNNLVLLSDIPDDHQIAVLLSRGNILIQADSAYRGRFLKLLHQIESCLEKGD